MLNDRPNHVEALTPEQCRAYVRQALQNMRKDLPPAFRGDVLLILNAMSKKPLAMFNVTS